MASSVDVVGDWNSDSHRSRWSASNLLIEYEYSENNRFIFVSMMNSASNPHLASDRNCSPITDFISDWKCWNSSFVALDFSFSKSMSLDSVDGIALSRDRSRYEVSVTMNYEEICNILSRIEGISVRDSRTATTTLKSIATLYLKSLSP